tara:strand:+ start:953 stop:1213 length:261 start_codon:yes stop_codon:yes gene_type:complete
MALTKREETGKCELVGKWKHIQVRIDTVIEEDGIEISRKYWRRAYTPADDMSEACDEAKKMAEVFWTDEHIEEYKTMIAEQLNANE